MAVTLAALTLGALLGAALTGRTAELGVGNLPILWLNGTLLFWAFAAIALLASASFDRLTPALGISLAFVLVSYFLEVLGSLWPDAAFLQPYSLFHYLDAKADLAGLPDRATSSSSAAVIAVAVGAALVRLPAAGPRRAGLTPTRAGRPTPTLQPPLRGLDRPLAPPGEVVRGRDPRGRAGRRPSVSRPLRQPRSSSPTIIARSTWAPSRRAARRRRAVGRRTASGRRRGRSPRDSVAGPRRVAAAARRCWSR